MKYWTGFLIIYSVSLTVLAGLLLYRQTSGNKADLAYNELVKKFPYLSKRILLDNKNDVLIHFVQLREALRESVAPYGDSFSFYFEYLPTGVSIEVNGKMEFTLASLLKVPYAMAFYAQQENQGLSYEGEVTLREEDLDSQFGLLWKRGAGAKLPVEEVLRIMLVESDDTAVRALSRYIDQNVYRKVYDGLDIELPQDVVRPTKLSAKSYSSILKSLYFSSILSKEHSQYILSLLTETEFNDKLVAGVPPGIPVAHKIGIIDRELYHDCGIIYEPHRPYLLCMLSRSSEADAQVRMKEISSLVYQYIHTIVH